jgi:hypothetical protein
LILIEKWSSVTFFKIFLRPFDDNIKEFHLSILAIFSLPVPGMGVELGNSGIRVDLNYWVINEIKQNEKLARAKVRNRDTIRFLSEIFVYTLVDK